jgi:hypothetical protein
VGVFVAAYLVAPKTAKETVLPLSVAALIIYHFLITRWRGSECHTGLGGLRVMTQCGPAPRSTICATAPSIPENAATTSGCTFRFAALDMLLPNPWAVADVSSFQSGSAVLGHGQR